MNAINLLTNKSAFFPQVSVIAIFTFLSFRKFCNFDFFFKGIYKVSNFTMPYFLKNLQVNG